MADPAESIPPLTVILDDGDPTPAMDFTTTAEPAPDEPAWKKFRRESDRKKAERKAARAAGLSYPPTRKTSIKHMKAATLRTRLAQLRVHIAQGHSDEQIAEEMSMGAESLEALKREFFRQETVKINRASAEEIFIEYSAKQTQCIQDLSEMIGTFRKTKQYNALVGAVRAKSDILDKIIKTGQDMGVLQKAPEKKMILHGFAVASMDNRKLRSLVVKELSGLAAVVKKFGDTDMEGNPIVDGEAEPLPALPAAPVMPSAPVFEAKGKPHRTSSKGKAAAARIKAKVVKAKGKATSGAESG